MCNTATLTNAEVAEALDDPRVLGMGEIVSSLPLVQCDEKLLEQLELAHRNGRFIHGHTTRLREMGSSFDKPIFALNFLAFVTLPALRIRARGLIDAKKRKIVPLFAD